MKTSQLGNKYAEKWTEETVLNKLEEIKKIIHNDDVNYIGTALVKVDLYRDVWSDWKHKFVDNELVSRTIKAIEHYFESKIYEKALSGQVNATVAIFGLKNNYNWKDKQETEITGKDGAPLGFTVNIVKTLKDDSGS